MKLIKLIIGLGNPGSKYKLRRHNLGFEVVEQVAERLKIATWHQKYEALVGFGNVSNQKLILAKPLTYMNSSGKAAVELLKAYQICIEDVCVVYDDISLDLGNLRIRKRGSDGGHKGMRSIIEYLNSQEVARLRLGIGPLPADIDPMDYVLSEFSKAEREIVAQMKVSAAEALENMMIEGVESAMNKYNKKNIIGQNRQNEDVASVV